MSNDSQLVQFRAIRPWLISSSGSSGTPNVTAPDATISSTDHKVSTANATTYTFTTTAIGTAASDRLIIVACSADGSAARTLNSGTIAGVSATVFATTNNGNACFAFMIALVPTGTTGDIVITWSGGCVRAGIGVWAAYNVQSTTPTDRQQSSASNSVSVNISAGGVGAGGACNDNATTPNFSWTQFTENYDEQEEPNFNHSGACNAYATAQTGLSVDCGAGSTTKRVVGVITFR